MFNLTGYHFLVFVPIDGINVSFVFLMHITCYCHSIMRSFIQYNSAGMTHWYSDTMSSYWLVSLEGFFLHLLNSSSWACRHGWMTCCSSMTNVITENAQYFRIIKIVVGVVLPQIGEPVQMTDQCIVVLCAQPGNRDQYFGTIFIVYWHIVLRLT